MCPKLQTALDHEHRFRDVCDAGILRTTLIVAHKLSLVVNRIGGCGGSEVAGARLHDFVEFVPVVSERLADYVPGGVHPRVIFILGFSAWI